MVEKNIKRYREIRKEEEKFEEKDKDKEVEV